MLNHLLKRINLPAVGAFFVKRVRFASTSVYGFVPVALANPKCFESIFIRPIFDKARKSLNTIVCPGSLLVEMIPRYPVVPGGFKSHTIFEKYVNYIRNSKLLLER